MRYITVFYCTVVWKRFKNAILGYYNICFPPSVKGGNIFKLDIWDGMKRVFLFLE
jgi:hypothetical protein